MNLSSINFNRGVNVEDMPIYQAIKQQSFKPFYKQFSNGSFKRNLNANLNPMNFMGATRKVASLEELTQTPQARAGIASFANSIRDVAKRTSREMAANYKQRMAEEAFQRANKGFDYARPIANYISRFK